MRETARLSPPEPSASDGLVSSDRQLFPAASLYPKSLLGRTRRSLSAGTQRFWVRILIPCRPVAAQSFAKGKVADQGEWRFISAKNPASPWSPIGLSQLSQPSNDHRSEFKSVICFSRVSEARAVYKWHKTHPKDSFGFTVACQGIDTTFEMYLIRCCVTKQLPVDSASAACDCPRSRTCEIQSTSPRN